MRLKMTTNKIPAWLQKLENNVNCSRKLILKEISQMRRYITKPNSRTDKVILFVLDMTSLMNCVIFCSSYIDALWLKEIIVFVWGL